MRIVHARFGGVVSFVDYKEDGDDNHDTDDVLESGSGQDAETSNPPPSSLRRRAPTNENDNSKPPPLSQRHRSKRTLNHLRQWQKRRNQLQTHTSPPTNYFLG